jgi:LemA protein
MVDIVMIAFIVVLIVLAYVVLTYNHLVNLRERYNNAWAQIDVQLKRRADLIPNLVDTVKGYMKHERETLKEITSLRTKILQGTPDERLEANDMLTKALKSIFAVAENYPNLKANENFLHLQEELTTTENKVAYARQAYNDVTYIYNTAIKQFPTSVVAAIFGFREFKYYEANEEERKPVRVKF